MATGRAQSDGQKLPLMHPGDECEHLQNTPAAAEPRTESCAECGDGRILRVCLTCGHVGCCDSSNGHARDHARQTGHRLIRAWKGGAFVYCYDHGYQ